MSKQREVLKLILEKYKADSNVRGVLVYGSVAKGLETENSDIDLWIYKNKGGFVHSVDRIHGIKLDLFEISIDMLERFIVSREEPAINSLLEGRVLYNKDIDIDRLINIALEVKKRVFIPIETMPRNRIISVIIQLQDLIDDAKDLVDDPIKFRLIFSEIVVRTYNNLYDFFGVWKTSPKRALEVFEVELPQIYPMLFSMLDDTVCPIKQIENAEKIIEIMADKYGGIPNSHILTELK